MALLNRRWISLVLHVLAATLLLVAGGTPVQAGLRLCNQSFDVLNVALAQPSGQGFATRGGGALRRTNAPCWSAKRCDLAIITSSRRMYSETRFL
ncbi:hypothetical protein ACFSS8_15450 [Paracoccus kondratievae]